MEYAARDEYWGRRVMEVAQKAAARLTEWGPFLEDVTIRIHPDHDSLEKAVGRHGYPWLRGWSSYRMIQLQSPRTWREETRQDFKELIAHELVHVLMYQTMATEKDWFRLRVPIWFREGMASVISEQQSRRGERTHLRAYYLSENYLFDPLTEAEALYQEEPGVVYAAAHHLFSDLLKEYGREKIMDCLHRMRAQQVDFRTAFRETFGVSSLGYAERWRDELVFQGAADGAVDASGLENPQEDSQEVGP